MIADPVLLPAIDRALLEDLEGGDLTTEATVPADARARGRAVAREGLVVCGGFVFERVMKRVDDSLVVTVDVGEGTRVAADTVLWTVEGSARSILMAERTALNFVQRASGIATAAERWVGALPEGATTRITDTRKTTPGLRALERYAVRTGGADNHRDSLGSAVMIKDNHIEAAGGITAAVRAARERAPHTSRIEVEVEDMEALDEAIDAGADIVMLDNFDPAKVKAAVERVAGRAIVEVSGGVTIDRVPALAQAGVDVISVGKLTHSVKAADIALDIERI